MDFILIYLQLYIPISMMLFCMNLLIAKHMPVQDPFELLNTLNDYVGQLREKDEKLGDLVEKFLNMLLEDKYFALIFVFFIFLIPILRFLIIIQMLKDFRSKD